MWRRRFTTKDTLWIYSIAVFCGLPRVEVSINSALSLISSHDSPPPPSAGNGGKKADMFEGNVLVKKYRGGRQEDYLKKGLALFWDLPVDICIYFEFKILMSYFENIYLSFG